MRSVCYQLSSYIIEIHLDGNYLDDRALCVHTYIRSNQGCSFTVSVCVSKYLSKAQRWILGVREGCRLLKVREAYLVILVCFRQWRNLWVRYPRVGL